MIKKWIRKIARQVLNENEETLIEKAVETMEAGITIPDVHDIVSELDMYDIACELDASDIACEIDTSEIAEHMDYGDVAAYIEIDVSKIEVDYDELSAYVAEDLDLEDIARHCDIDKTIFTHIHMLQTKLDALIAVVNDSAMHTIDLMLLNRALEGEEQ